MCDQILCHSDKYFVHFLNSSVMVGNMSSLDFSESQRALRKKKKSMPFKECKVT